MLRALVSSAVGLVVAVAPVLAQPEPPAPAGDAPHQKAAAKPKIYDEGADAKAAIDAALARAARDNQRVLIQWGANWCPWCHLLHGTFKDDAKIKKELSYEYQVVLVDVGRFDKNIELADELGAMLKKTGIPYLTVLGADGKPLANQETGALEDPDKQNPHHDAAKVLAFLKEHEASPLSAEDVLSKALATARADGRKVFLHYGAPWCPWCHRLDDWIARPDVAAILGKDFVNVKIDTDRMISGEASLKQFRGSDQGGIPWFVLLDPTDSAGPKALATSDAPGPHAGNIGFPAKPEEIEYFIGVMRKTAKNMTSADIDALRASLNEKEKPTGDSPHTVPMMPIRAPD